MHIDLTGRTAVVTGAGGILAGRFALEIARAGAKVALLDINLEAARETQAAIEGIGGIAAAIHCDVLDRASVEEAERRVSDALGPYQLLINAAGGNDVRVSTSSEQYSEEDADNPEALSFFDLPVDGFNRVVALNLTGTFVSTQVFARKMLREKDPAVVNISSMSAYTALTKVVAYSAAKAAINSLTQWLAVHFGNTGLRVNAIAPGFIVTHQNRRMMTNPDGSLTARSQKVMNHTPMKRMGEAEDLVGALLFLCDARASGYINGVILPVDGGFMATPGV